MINFLSFWYKRKLLRILHSQPKNFIVKGPLAINILGTLVIGNDVLVRSSFHNQVEIDIAKKASLIINDGVFINQGTRIVCTKKIMIGEKTLIGDDVLIIDNDFHAMENGIAKSESIVIGDNVWLASRVIVLRGVAIGAGSVIGAGAVVTRSIPPNSFAAGAPARVLKSINRI